MNPIWGLLMAAVGLFMLVCGSIKSTFIIYRLMAERSRMVWGDGVHRFYQISGAIVIIVGTLIVLGVF